MKIRNEQKFIAFKLEKRVKLQQLSKDLLKEKFKSWNLYQKRINGPKWSYCDEITNFIIYIGLTSSMRVILPIRATGCLLESLEYAGGMHWRSKTEHFFVKLTYFSAKNATFFNLNHQDIKT